MADHFTLGNWGWLIAGLVGLYLLAVVLAWVFQPRLVYFPSALNIDEGMNPSSVGLPYESVRISTEDGETLYGWWLPHQDLDAKTLLFFHGNAGSIEHRLQTLKMFHSLGVNVFIFDYRGFGASTGTPSEQGTYLDAKASWQYLTQDRSIAAKDIILAGRSLGAAVAAWLSLRVEPAGLVMESAFTSLPAVGQRVYWWIPVKWLSRIHYNSIERLRRFSEPLLVLHSRDDELIPFDHGQALFDAAASRRKEFTELRGSHAQAHILSSDDYIQAFKAFLVLVQRE